MSDRQIPSPEDLRKAVCYDPNTGLFYFRSRDESEFSSQRRAKLWEAKYAGKEAYSTTNWKGYKTGRFGKTTFLAHRAAWAVYYGEWPKGQIDHINGNKADNRIANLRVVSGSINCRNKTQRKDNSSGFAGVSWKASCKRWQVSAPDQEGGQRYVGIFPTIEEAVAARLNAIEGMGFTERHGAASND